MGGNRTTSAVRIPSQSNSRRHLDYLTMRGGGRVRRERALSCPVRLSRRVRARVAGKAGKARTARVGWIRLSWATGRSRVSQVRGRGGQQLGSGTAAERGLAHKGGPCQSHGMRAYNWLLPFSVGRVAMGVVTQTLSSLLSVPGPGWPSLESRTWAGGSIE